MIKIYTSPNCSSCKKAKQYFNDNNIPYVEKNILTKPLTKEELKEILQLTSTGSDEIISKRSKIVKEENVNFDDMKISDLIEYIIKNPSILKRPIIVNDKQLQIGYNKEEIKSLKRIKKSVAEFCPGDNCPNYENCNSTYGRILLQAQYLDSLDNND